MADKYVSNDPSETVVRRDGLGTALVVLTTLALIGALLLVEKAKEKHFDTGLFGKTKGVPNVEMLAERAVMERREAPPPAR
jgi:hypothetical protein